VADEDGWSLPPFSGAVRDGKIFGRGASDMKGGTTALVFAYALLNRLGFRPTGRLSCLLVSDEEDGGENGLAWLLDTQPDLVGDAAIIGEPNSVDQVSIANKGIVVLRLVARGEAYHGGIGTGDNAITRLAAAVLAIRGLVDDDVEPPAAMAEVLATQRARDLTGADERHRGLGWLVTHPTLNVGTIEGGVRHNIAPHHAEAVVDIRTPLGMAPDQCVARVRELLDAAGCSNVEVVPHRFLFFPPHFTSPIDPFPQLVSRNVAQVIGRPPVYILTFPSGDIRWFRFRGIPAVVYGTNPHNVGGVDEFITVEDLVTIAKVYTGSIIDYFEGAP